MRANPSSEHSEPLHLASLSTAPLSGAMVALVAVWIMAIPMPVHSVAFDLAGDGCVGIVGPEAPRVQTVTIDMNGVVAWDGEVLASREVLESRMLAIGAMTRDEQPQLHVVPHPLASYGAFMSVMAAAQHHGVGAIRMIGEDSVEMRIVPAKG
jgi:biopolymer transport protein ExbD